LLPSPLLLAQIYKALANPYTTLYLSMPRFNKHPIDLLKTVLKNNHLRSASSDAFDSGFGDIRIQSDIDSPEPEEEHPEHPSARYELQQRLFSLMDNCTHRKPVPTLEELQSSYAEVSNVELITLISVCTQFICLSVEVSTIKREEVGSTEATGTAEILSKKWEECTKDSLERNSSDELRELLVSAFNDIEAYIDVIEEGKGLESGLPIINAGAGAPETGKDGA
jgi:hypothetical protein